MIGAIEFLRKAKAICENQEHCTNCPIFDFCLCDMDDIENEADLVHTVMDYEIKEEKDAERN